MLLDLRAEARRHAVALPTVPTVGDLDPALLRAAQRTWQGRMINEHGSAPVFEGLARQLRDAGVAAEHVAACERFADEERAHGALCAAVVEAFGGEPRAEIEAPRDFPEHADVAPLEAITRNVLSIACLSETVAVAILTAERCEMLEATTPPDPATALDLRDVLTRILADEVGHARFGWRWLAEIGPTLDDATRARLSAYLRVAFATLEKHELDNLSAKTSFPAGAAALGLCDGADARELFYDTVRTVILPQLDAHGLCATDAWNARVSLG